MATYDKIEKQVTLRAPVSRVWRAIADAHEFGRWFGVRLEGDFAVGKTIIGTFDEGLNEAAIIGYQKSLGLSPSNVRLPDKNTVFCTVERIEPERYFSFRWIPYGIDTEIDPQNEPTTLVELRLEKVTEGTLLTIVESGFDQVPAHRRERAFRMNEGGWAGQAENIRKYVEST
ncbi:MAG TPA: SRPBCC family protein [Haliangium sp.]|nr:SRPBCC family protein [Haliangium sp.]